MAAGLDRGISRSSAARTLAPDRTIADPGGQAKCPLTRRILYALALVSAAAMAAVALLPTLYILFGG
jgi:hypothetical protein